MRQRGIVILFLALCLVLCGCSPKEADDMDFTLEINGDRINGSYTGPLKKGLPQGEGSFKSRDFTYKGGWDDGLPSGIGTVTEMDLKLTIGGETYKGIYEGEVLAGIPFGNGSFTENRRKGDFFYEGGWDDGLPKGSGTVRQLPLTLEYTGEEYTGIYEGEVLNGIPDGEGSFSGEGGSGVFDYQGGWESGGPGLSGTLECPHYILNYHGEDLPGAYSGPTENGLPQGEGTFDYQSGEDYMHYSGGWEAGAMAGAGEMESSVFVITVVNSGVTDDRIGTYTGGTQDGLASGQGVFETVNPEGVSYTYTGGFQNGLFHGQGIRITENAEALEYSGTYIDGAYCPTPYELMQCLSGDPTMSYSITKDSGDILKQYPDVFLKNSFGTSGLSEAEYFSYSEYIKNPEASDGGFFTRQDLKVVQVRPSNEFWEGTEFTYLFLTNKDETKLYNVYIMGHFDHIKEGSTVTMTALPLDYAAYEDVNLGTAWAMMCAAVNIIPS